MRARSSFPTGRTRMSASDTAMQKLHPGRPDPRKWQPTNVQATPVFAQNKNEIRYRAHLIAPFSTWIRGGSLSYTRALHDYVSAGAEASGSSVPNGPTSQDTDSGAPQGPASWLPPRRSTLRVARPWRWIRLLGAGCALLAIVAIAAA